MVIVVKNARRGIHLRTVQRVALGRVILTYLRVIILRQQTVQRNQRVRRGIGIRHIPCTMATRLVVISAQAQHIQILMAPAVASNAQPQQSMPT